MKNTDKKHRIKSIWEKAYVFDQQRISFATYPRASLLSYKILTTHPSFIHKTKDFV